MAAAGLIGVGEYHRMIDAGVLGEDEHVQLVAGALVAMTPQGSRHAVVIQRLTTALVRLVGDDLAVRPQLPLTLGGDSEPEPDLAVVRACETPLSGPHPGAALLVVEVSGDSLRFDREDKAAVYAKAGIAEYWIVNLGESVVEVHRDPFDGVYRERSAVTPPAAVVSSSLPGVAVDLGRILG